MKLKVASPCPMSWDEMSGDDRMRFCDRCELNVFNLSAMTEEELGTFMEQKKGDRLCGRFFQRPDGTVMTSDCPVGWRRKIVKRIAIGATFLLGMIFTLTAFGESERTAEYPSWIQAALDWLGLSTPPQPTPQSFPTVGEICPPAPAPPTTPR